MTNIESSRMKKSLCEESMLLVANVIKFSSLSLANLSFGTTLRKTARADKNRVPLTAKLPSINNVSMVRPQLPRTKRSLQEPESNSSKPYSNSHFNIEPEKDNSSYNLIRENNIDERATEYIKRIHGKNRN